MYNTVECPYCEHENDMTDALSDGLPSDNKFDWECSECEKEFEVYVEFDPSYSASKIEIINCDMCNNETRDIYEKGRVYPFPESLAGKRVCEKCWSGTYFKELESIGTTEPPSIGDAEAVEG